MRLLTFSFEKKRECDQCDQREKESPETPPSTEMKGITVVAKREISSRHESSGNSWLICFYPIEDDICAEKQ